MQNFEGLTDEQKLRKIADRFASDEKKTVKKTNKEKVKQRRIIEDIRLAKELGIDLADLS